MEETKEKMSLNSSYFYYFSCFSFLVLKLLF